MQRFLLLSSFVLLSVAACTSTTTTSEAPAPAGTQQAEGEETPAEDTSPTTPSPEGPTAFSQSEVQTLFEKRCVRCHAGATTVVDLSGDFTKTTLGVQAAARGKCADSATPTRIVAGDREASLLWLKVNGTHDCGDAMPPPGKGTKLTATELERLGLYIDQLESPK